MAMSQFLFYTFRAQVLVLATGKVTGTILIEFEAQAFDISLMLLKVVDP
jgi:hypothetical protein